jgi:predicted nucleic acid-binding protein
MITMDAPYAPQPIVVDTNVALDWLAFQDASTHLLEARVSAGVWQWQGTAAMREELADVLTRPAFDRFDSAQVMGRWDTLVTVRAEPARGPLVCADPDDQVFIDLAWALSVPFLFTRDRELLRLARAAEARGITVCTPLTAVTARTRRATTGTASPRGNRVK